jgi:hypothetical protein
MGEKSKTREPAKVHLPLARDPQKPSQPQHPAQSERTEMSRRPSGASVGMQPVRVTRRNGAGLETSEMGEFRKKALTGET